MWIGPDVFAYYSLELKYRVQIELGCRVMTKDRSCCKYDKRAEAKDAESRSHCCYRAVPANMFTSGRRIETFRV